MKTWLLFENCSPIISVASAKLWTSRSLALLMICASLASLPSCGPGIRHVSLSNPTIRANGETEVTREGLTVSVEPITWENASRYPEIVRSFTIRSGRATGTASGAITPLPAFRIRIVNHTGHVVRFTQSIIRLSDNLSRNSQAMTQAELVAWVQGAWREGSVQDPSLESQLLGALGSLQLLSRETELLNGDEWAGYLVFNLGVTSTDDYRRVLGSVSRYTPRLAEVPIEVGDAGQITRTTEFAFAFDRAEYPQSVACPGRGEPSWDICAME